MINSARLIISYDLGRMKYDFSSRSENGVGEKWGGEFLKIKNKKFSNSYCFPYQNFLAAFGGEGSKNSL